MLDVKTIHFEFIKYGLGGPDALEQKKKFIYTSIGKMYSRKSSRKAQ